MPRWRSASALRCRCGDVGVSGQCRKDAAAVQLRQQGGAFALQMHQQMLIAAGAEFIPEGAAGHGFGFKMIRRSFLADDDLMGTHASSSLCDPGRAPGFPRRAIQAFLPEINAIFYHGSVRPRNRGMSG